MRLLHRVFIVCIFLILCIFLIYFAMKNKQIENFVQSGLIVVKSTIDDDSVNDLRIYSFSVRDNIKLVQKISDDNIEALFYDERRSGSKFYIKESTSSDIQIINVVNVTNVIYTVKLDNKGKVYVNDVDVNLNDIIQITPYGIGEFIALTNYNMLISCDIDTTTPSGTIKDIDENSDPIVSVQGFQKDKTCIYLTMSGELKYITGDIVKTMSSKSISRAGEKVIQFNVPTYSSWSPSVPICSYISFYNGSKNVVFYNGTYYAVENKSNVITTLVLSSVSQEYKCYVLNDSKELYEYEYLFNRLIVVNGYGGGGKFIDQNIYNITSIGDKLYYVKNGGIYCSPEYDGKSWFSNSNQDNCMTCGSNVIINETLLPNNILLDDTAAVCSCISPSFTHYSRNSNFPANSNEIGCANYVECTPITGDICGPGLFMSNIPFYQGNGSCREPSCPITCDVCSACSTNAGDAVAKGGVIQYGESHPFVGNPINDGPCSMGEEGCEYYVLHKCTASNDTIFAKQTTWNDFVDAGADSNVYITEQSIVVTGSGEFSNREASTGDANNPDGTTNNNFVNFSEGKDNTFNQCTDSSCCTVYKEVGDSTGDEYDCTNGRNRICSGCEKDYMCTSIIENDNIEIDIDIFHSPTSINTILNHCGHNIDYTNLDVFKKLATRTGDDCDTLDVSCGGMYGRTSECPLFSTKCFYDNSECGVFSNVEFKTSNCHQFSCSNDIMKCSIFL
jgi:hypothetical protein